MPAMSRGEQRVLAVVNPAAGDQGEVDVEGRLRASFAAAAGFDLHRTEPGEDLPAIVGAAIDGGVDLVVVCGGDGTVSEVAAAVAGRDCRLAIVPGGTANLLARELGLPLDLEAAIDLARQPEKTARIDVMRTLGRHAISHISLGTYSRMAAQSQAGSAKKRFGRFYYLWLMLRELGRRRRWPFDIEVDGRLHRLRASLVMVANIGAVGLGDLTWGSSIRPDDGAVDVCIVHGRSMLDYARYLLRARRKLEPEPGKQTQLRARQRVRIGARASLPIRIDGDIVGHGAVDVEVIAGALQVVVATDDRDV